MLKTLTTAAGMVLLISSFGLAGQTATTTKPPEQPKAVQSQNTPTNAKTSNAKKHRKHHKKHHAQTTKK